MTTPASVSAGRRSISAAMFAVVATAKPTPSSATQSASSAALLVWLMSTNESEESAHPAATSVHARCER
jgi:hypothetical protein